MTDPEDHVPPGVLDELSAAFGLAPSIPPAEDPSTDDPPAPDPTTDEPASDEPGSNDPASDNPPAYDFDDPRIDELLGLGVGDEPNELAGEPGGQSGEKSGEQSVPVVAGHDVRHTPVDPLLAASTPPSGGAGDAHAAEGARRTIVIEETDLPDAVYLDEEAEQRLRTVHGHDDSAAATTIVIGDVDGERQVEPAPAASRPPIDPRVRARRIAVGRAKGRRRLVVVSLVLGILALVIAGLAVLGSSWFSVERIDLQGAAYSRADVERIVSSTKGEPVLLVDTVKLERQLEALPWVESATVDTDFPHGLFVDVRERVPVAYFLGSDGRARAIDRDARVLAVLNGIPTQYPQITGNAPDTGAGQQAGVVFQGAAILILSLPPELSTQMKSVGADSSAGTLTMKLTTGATVRLGPPTDLTRKLARLLLVVRQSDFKKLRLIDVSAADVSTK